MVMSVLDLRLTLVSFLLFVIKSARIQSLTYICSFSVSCALSHLTITI